MHAMDDVELPGVDERLEVLAERVRAGARSGRPLAVLAHLHDVLFDRERFCGDTQNYYSPLNSYLPVVLENRRGLPIILAVIYKAVAERVGLRVEGINSPGHFLARVFVDGKWIIIDPFDCELHPGIVSRRHIRPITLRHIGVGGGQVECKGADFRPVDRRKGGNLEFDFV